MRRSRLLSAAAVLATVTALLLAGAAVAIHLPALPAETDAPQEAENRRLAHAFYDAANVVIATGDLAPIATLVAPDILDGGEAQGAEPGSTGLRRRLLALHATAPGLRLTVAALAVDGDLAIAQVGTEGTGATAFLSLSLSDRPLLWGPIDVLRLADGQVVGYTGGAEGAEVVEPELATSLDLTPGAPHTITVHRIVVDPAARHALATVDGPRLLYLEAGRLTVDVAATPEAAARSATLRAGEHLTIPAGVDYAATNSTGAPAVLLDFAASKAGYATPPTGLAEPRAGDGVSVTVLAHIVPPMHPVVLAVGRATLEPGAMLAWTAADGPVLLHVEAGTPHLGTTGGTAWVRGGESGRAITDGDVALATGDAALLPSGTAARLRVDAPTTILIVTLLPANGSAVGQ